MNWLSGMQNEWRQLGEQLGISNTALEVIQNDLGRPKPIGKLSEVISKWKRSACSPYTFENLLECLKKMDEAKECIKLVEKNLRDPDIVKEYTKSNVD